jgi:GNAT superfamily N-acetyltransferase
VDTAARIQRYMITSRQANGTSLPVGPFVVLLHASDDDVESNVAMPVVPEIGAPASWLEPLRQAFAEHGRPPAIHWVEEYAPGLAATLKQVGFHEHQRKSLFFCTAETLRVDASLPDLTFLQITDASSLSDVREGLDVNEFGFDPTGAQAATDEQACAFRVTLSSARAFTARQAGHPAGAGMYIDPQDGVTELTGIATLEAFRGRGVAGALASYMVQTALEHGCDLIFLRTTSPAARRAYERAGFQPLGSVLTYVAGGSDGQ